MWFNFVTTYILFKKVDIIVDVFLCLGHLNIKSEIFLFTLYINYTLSVGPSSTCRIHVSRIHQAPAPDLPPMIASGCAAAVVHARYSGPYLGIDQRPVRGRAQGHRSHRSLCCQELVLSRRTGYQAF